VDQAGRGDEFVSGITSEVQLSNTPADGQVERPNVHPGQHYREIGRMNVQADPSELEELGELPKHDGRDTSLLIGQQMTFARS